MTVHAPIAQAERTAAAGISFLRRPGRGAADPIVLLHGIGSNAQSFAALTSAIAVCARCDRLECAGLWRLAAAWR